MIVDASENYLINVYSDKRAKMCKVGYGEIVSEASSISDWIQR